MIEDKWNAIYDRMTLVEGRRPEEPNEVDATEIFNSAINCPKIEAHINAIAKHHANGNYDHKKAAKAFENHIRNNGHAHKGASPATVRMAAEKIADQYHPDKQPGSWIRSVSDSIKAKRSEKKPKKPATAKPKESKSPKNESAICDVLKDTLIEHNFTYQDMKVILTDSEFIGSVCEHVNESAKTKDDYKSLIIDIVNQLDEE